MVDFTEILPFQITDQPIATDPSEAINEELAELQQESHHIMMEGSRRGDRIIKKYIQRFPNDPVLKNHLCNWYGQVGKESHYVSMLKKIFEDHPDYLFGKLGIASHYMAKGKPETIFDYFGKDLQLPKLFPDRNLFHISEVINFEMVVRQYLFMVGKGEQSLARQRKLLKMASTDYVIGELEELISQTESMLMSLRMERLIEKQLLVTPANVLSPKQKRNAAPPKFHHQETQWLYETGFAMSDEKFDSLLALPAATFIEDLRLVMQDSIDRYGFFLEEVEKNGWDEERHSFLVHAFFFAGQLQASSLLHTMLEIMSYDDDFLNFYLEGFLQDELWAAIYKVSAGSLETLQGFMRLPGIYTHCKSVMGTVVQQIALHHPDGRQECIEWFSEVFHFFTDASTDDNVIDSALLELLVVKAVPLEPVALLPVIKRLYDQEYVAGIALPNYEAAAQAIREGADYEEKKELPDIRASYQYILEEQETLEDDEPEWDFSEDDESLFDWPQPQIESAPVRTEPKVGRNSPCPCGSGKKYKKCCG